MDERVCEIWLRNDGRNERVASLAYCPGGPPEIEVSFNLRTWRHLMLLLVLGARYVLSCKTRFVLRDELVIGREQAGRIAVFLGNFLADTLVE